MTDKIVELNEAKLIGLGASSGLVIRTLMADDMFMVLDFADKLDLTDKIIEFLEKQDEAKDALTKQAAYQFIIQNNPGSKEAKAAAKDLEAITNEISKQSFDVIGQVVKLLLGNLKTIKTELNGFLANILVGDYTAETVGQLPLGQYVGLLRDFFEVTKSELKQLFTLSK